MAWLSHNVLAGGMNFTQFMCVHFIHNVLLQCDTLKHFNPVNPCVSVVWDIISSINGLSPVKCELMMVTLQFLPQTLQFEFN